MSHPTEWDLFTKSNDAVQTYLWELYPSLDHELLLDAFRARMMFERPLSQWESHVRRMLAGEIECGAMVRHYRHSLIHDHVREMPPARVAASAATETRPRRAKRRKR